MLHTTFARAKKAGACLESYKKFAKYKGKVTKWGKDKPFPLSEVLEVCGLNDALWCLRIAIEDADREICLFACDCAERVLPLFERIYPNEKRSREAIEVSRRFANGEATIKELAAARDAARDAAWVVGDAAWAAWVVGDAAWAAWVVDWDAAGDAEKGWQRERFIQLLNSVGDQQ